MGDALDLAAYLSRIGLKREPLGSDFPSLAALHRAHVASIPFENIDVQAGRPIALDIPWLHEKLVTRRRGGYCFEQNTYFSAALESLGFVVKACEARVRPQGATEVRPRTHMVLVAHAGHRTWLCDVGFGGEGLFEPAPLDGGVVFQVDREFRVTVETPLLVLQWRKGGDGDWQDAYAFAPEARYPVDFEVANWYASTHPASTFRTRLTIQRTTAEARHMLRNLTYTIARPGHPEDVTEVDRTALPTLFREVFDLVVDDTAFPGLDKAPSARV